MENPNEGRLRGEVKVGGGILGSRTPEMGT